MEPKLDFWYLASPYSKYPAGPEQAWIDICKVAGQLMLNGVRIFCPIAMGHPISQHAGVAIEKYEIWLPQDEAIMQHAAGILVCCLDGWDKSTGVSWEIKKFNEWGKPVCEFEPGMEKDVAEDIKTERWKLEYEAY